LNLIRMSKAYGVVSQTREFPEKEKIQLKKRRRQEKENPTRGGKTDFLIGKKGKNCGVEKRKKRNTTRKCRVTEEACGEN